MKKVVHIRRDECDVYIGRGRGSVWGNPFRIGADGTREEVIEKYKNWLLRGAGRPLLRRLGELEGKTLGCWCAPPGGLGAADELICHGQILLKLLAYRSKKIQQKEKLQRGDGDRRRQDRRGPGLLEELPVESTAKGGS